MLDDKVRSIFTIENFKNEFFKYKKSKTDIYTGNIKVQMGVDGVDCKTFEKTLDLISMHICKRVSNGKFFFSPFRELEVPKSPFTNLTEARKFNKTRVLSIATIKDVIFQKLFYTAIEEFCENKFATLNEDVSYAYRKGKSSRLAINKIYSEIVKNKYLYALDGDIKKFFDEIPHDLLLEKIEAFFGEDNILVISYLKRFFSADRVKFSDYKGKVSKYYNKKPKRDCRKIGIPQGGVLSGLVANIYMYDFDNYVINKLYIKYDRQIKYFRYADDFVILFNDKDIIEQVFNDVKEYLANQRLTIHDIGEKTKVIDMTEKKKEKLEFLGFELSQRGISVKKDNILKFKKRIVENINKTKIYKSNSKKGLEILINRIRYKILGNVAFEDNIDICNICGLPIQRRNWLMYFSIITDVRVLRQLDIWIRKSIYRYYYYKTGRRLMKKDLLGLELPSLEKFYYEYRKEHADSNGNKYCHCSIYLDDDDQVIDK